MMRDRCEAGSPLLRTGTDLFPHLLSLLTTDISERTAMPGQTSVTPEGYTTVAPWVVTDDTGAFLDFVTQAFEGEELGRVPTEDGLIGHGEIRVGDTVVLAFDRHADWPVMPSLLRVFVADAGEAFSRAIAAGGYVVTPVADDAFGQRGDVSRTPSATSGGWSAALRTSLRTSLRTRCGRGCKIPYMPRPCAWRRRRSTPSSAAGAAGAAAHRPRQPPGRSGGDRAGAASFLVRARTSSSYFWLGPVPGSPGCIPGWPGCGGGCCAPTFCWRGSMGG